MRTMTLAIGMVVLAAVATACSSDSGGEASSGAGASASAYLVAVRVDSVDDRFIYMGAFSELPTSEPSRDHMVELVGSWQVSGFDGSAYAWDQDTGQMTRWTLDGGLNLVKGNTMSLANLGLDGWRYHAFISPTRAYTLGLENGNVAVWNPTTMELVKELHFDSPPDFAGMEAYPLSVIVRGTQIIVPMYGDNWDAQRIATRQVVGIVETTTDSVSFITDSRCLPSGLGHMNEAGDIYLDPYQSGTFFKIYGQQASLPPPCTLRIKAGQNAFDPDYLLDYSTVLGTHAEGVWPISGGLVMALSVSPAATIPPPTAQDDYWSLPQVASVVDVKTKQARPYPGLPADLKMQSALQTVVGGISYYQNYKYDARGNIDFVEVGALTTEGWKKQFEIHGGDLWRIAKLR